LASSPGVGSAGATRPAHVHEHAAPTSDTYTCPMHPQIVKNAPGKCPICGMNLVKKGGAAPEGAAH
jgi:membrane fusion protein, copper/silver efflux system